MKLPHSFAVQNLFSGLTVGVRFAVQRLTGSAIRG
jgi:hypothetical protein